MATKLGVYQDALRLLGDVRLATTSDDVESRYALDDAWDDAIVYMLRYAPWRFALATTDPTQSGAGVGGFTYGFTKPADWLRTHAIFVDASGRECPVDVKEQAGSWSANVDSITVRYISDDYTDPGDWTENFASALAAYLAFTCCERITGDAERTEKLGEYARSEANRAASLDADPEDAWLRHQLSGAFRSATRELLAHGLWGFATKTVTLTKNSDTPSAGYAYAFDKPADWFKTITLYELVGDEPRDIPFRDEGGDFHADVLSPILRYLSQTLADDSTAWPEDFNTALLALLGLREAMARPDTAGAVLQARQQAYEAAVGEARMRNDNRQRPRVDRRGSFTRARGGYVNREQGY